MRDGEITGWDLAGVVERAARRRQRAAAGTRVVGLVARGAWAELAAVDTAALAALPQGVSDAQAATLPVAGLTALTALDIIGSVLGAAGARDGRERRRGALRGAAGALAGAHVTAVSASAERARGLAELGADEVIAELEPSGSSSTASSRASAARRLGAALQRVAPGGAIVSFASSDPGDRAVPHAVALRPRLGRAAPRPAALRPARPRTRGAQRPRAPAGLVDAGRLDCSIDREASWRGAARRSRRCSSAGSPARSCLRVD